MKTLTPAEYLELRGWWRVTDRDWKSSILGGPLSTSEAVCAQQGVDIYNERRCVSDAIANAAARHSKSAPGITLDQKADAVHTAASLAQREYRDQFGVMLKNE